MFARRCAYGEFCKSGPFLEVSNVPKSRFAWPEALFRVASVALCDIPTCFITCPKSFRAAGAIFVRRFQKMSCIFRGRHNTLETSIVISRGRRSTSAVSCCVFASSGDNV